MAGLLGCNEQAPTYLRQPPDRLKGLETFMLRAAKRWRETGDTTELKRLSDLIHFICELEKR